jgi:hypothetical protein
VDSIVRWLGLVQTYTTDLRLARHYYFSGDFSKFDLLWGQIPTKYTLDTEHQDQYGRLDGVYTLLRQHLQQGGLLGNVPKQTLTSLIPYTNTCDEAGFLAEIILRRNGIERATDCSEEAAQRTIPEKDDKGGSEKTAALRMYPNPANNLLRVEWPISAQSGQFRIFDLQGRLVREVKLPEQGGLIDIGTSGIPNGLYTAQWHCNGQTGYSKLIIAH